MQHLGTVSQAIDKFVEVVQKTNPALANIDRTLMKQHFEIKSRGLRSTRQTRTANGRFGTSHVQIRIDRFQLGTISAEQVRASPTAALDAASGALLRLDEWPDNGLARWKTLMNGSFKLGFVQAFLQLWSLHKLGGELDKAAPDERSDKQWKYRSAAMGAVGGVLELADSAITNSYKIGGGLSRLNGMFAKFVRFGARTLGLGAAVITAVFDIANAFDEASLGNTGMAALYTVSAIAGVSSFLLMAGWLGSWVVLGIAASGWGLILLAVFIAVGLLIEYLKEDQIEQWLGRCWFGDGERYPDVEAELKAFEQATKADPDAKKAASSDTESILCEQGAR